jgi:hypothetical protein
MAKLCVLFLHFSQWGSAVELGSNYKGNRIATPRCIAVSSAGMVVLWTAPPIIPFTYSYVHFTNPTLSNLRRRPRPSGFQTSRRGSKGDLKDFAQRRKGKFRKGTDVDYQCSRLSSHVEDLER